MLEVDIRKKLANFDLELKFKLDQESLAILGASGCGKSMTLKSIAGIEKPDSGRIVLNDRILFDSDKNINLKPQERRVGLLFQSYCLFPNMTLRDNIKIGIRKGREKEGQLESLIESFSLNGLEDLYPHQLSGGQQQRVALARMLINEPELLMLDEPFSALDEHLRWNMEIELAKVLKDLKKPTIYVSHNKDEAFRLSDQVMLMDSGQILEKGDKKTIFSQPQSTYGALLLGYKNITSIKQLSPSRVYAQDWGLELELDALPHHKHMAVAMENIDISYSEEDANRMLGYLVDKIEDIEYYILVISFKEDGRPIYMALDKDRANYNIGDKIAIKIDKEKTFLFK